MNDKKIQLPIPNGWNDPPFITHTYNGHTPRLRDRLVHPEVSLINTTRTNIDKSTSKENNCDDQNEYEDTSINKTFIFDTLNDSFKKIQNLTSKSNAHLDEIQHKIWLFQSEWNNNNLNLVIKQNMLLLAKSLLEEKYDNAYNIQSNLMKLYPLQVNAWLIGIKKLIVIFKDHS